MKGSYLLTVIIIISAALGIGWFFDEKKATEAINTLEVPDNIDYYLSNLKYRSMNPQGTLHYQLETPYLEHYILQNSSQLQQPRMQFNGENSSWFISAESGNLLHAEQQFTLHQQVELKRNSSRQPMQLNTDLMILKAHNNLIQIPQKMLLNTNNMNLKAGSAELNINQNRYKFKQVKATYIPVISQRFLHEQS